MEYQWDAESVMPRIADGFCVGVTAVRPPSPCGAGESGVGSTRSRSRGRNRSPEPKPEADPGAEAGAGAASVFFALLSSRRRIDPARCSDVEPKIR